MAKRTPVDQAPRYPPGTQGILIRTAPTTPGQSPVLLWHTTVAKDRAGELWRTALRKADAYATEQASWVTVEMGPTRHPSPGGEPPVMTVEHRTSIPPPRT